MTFQQVYNTIRNSLFWRGVEIPEAALRTISAEAIQHIEDNPDKDECRFLSDVIDVYEGAARG